MVCNGNHREGSETKQAATRTLPLALDLIPSLNLDTQPQYFTENDGWAQENGGTRVAGWCLVNDQYFLPKANQLVEDNQTHA